MRLQILRIGAKYKKWHALCYCAILLTVMLPGTVRATNGYFAHGVGSVNEALGGAGTAGNAQDLLGSLYRNPANSALFDKRLASISLEAIFPDATISSSVAMLNASGTSESDVRYIPVANLGMVFGNDDSPFSCFAAFISEGGLHLDIKESFTNPIFLPQAGAANNPFGGALGGFGAVETQFEMVRLMLGTSYAMDDKLSLGFSIAPSVLRLKYTPAAFSAADDANGDTIFSYPTDVDHSYAMGIGFQAGARYQATPELGLGVTFTSPTWFENCEWDVTDEAGHSREISFQLNRPLSMAIGLNYQLTKETLFLVDLLWLQYSGATGFEDTGLNSDGSLRGLGWDDQWVVALGIQHDITQAVTVRVGYNYGASPIDNDVAVYNVGTPLNTEHHLSLGASFRLNDLMVLDLAYTYAFEGSSSGPMYDATGAIPGTRFESELSYDQVGIGLTVSF
ncbi:MAG: hypothetical protein CR984_02195 [Proteobacteria bacterium]|nr:MAG: hypothetical protein CR984_02195 [Pseudomonadota bacterium]